MRSLLLAAAFLGGCSLMAPFDLAPLREGEGGAGGEDGGDGAADGADGADGGRDAPGPDADAGADAEIDAEIPDLPLPRPFTLVVSEMQFSVEPLCDVDGDGSLDNALARLDATEAQLFATGLNQALQAEIDHGYRLLLRLSSVGEDGARLAMALGQDPLCPRYDVDDFTGDGPYLVRAESLDGCGEPRHLFASVGTAGRVLVAADGEVPLPGLPSGRGAVLLADLEDRSLSGPLRLCAQLTIRELAGSSGLALREELSALQELLVGAQVLGQPQTAGLQPDVDVDGDGLESFVVQNDGVIVSCVDGDGTVLESSSCWLDERMADAFSVALSLTTRTAEVVGAESRWRELVDEPCDEAFEGPSSWGPCSTPAVCGRQEHQPCVAACGMAGTEHCSWDCSSWGPCLPDDEPPPREVALVSCDDLDLAGGATCAGDPPAVQLTDGLSQARGFLLGQAIAVGRGPATIEARVVASRQSTDVPGDGWALVVFTSAGSDWLGPGGGGLGVGGQMTGFCLEWRIWNNFVGEDWDIAAIRPLTGTGAPSHDIHPACLEDCYFGLSPRLDAETDGEVDQAFRLVIHPDLPETERNELLVTAELVDGDEILPMGIGCRCDDCPVQIQSGDLLRAGVTAGAGALDANVVVAGLTAQATEVCE